MSFRKSITFSTLLVVILFASASAAQKTITRGEVFPDVYSEQPHSILVLPPINTSTTPEAGTYYMETIELPFTSAGYSVLSEEQVNGIIKQKGIHDTRQLYTMPLKTLYDNFGSDAVLYTRIRQWEIAHTGLISRLIIFIEAELMSTKTSTQLWTYTSSVNVDLNTVKTTGGAVQLLLKKNRKNGDKAYAESIAYSFKATTKLTQNLPFGPGHEGYLRDQSIELIGNIPDKIMQRIQPAKEN